MYAFMHVFIHLAFYILEFFRSHAIISDLVPAGSLLLREVFNNPSSCLPSTAIDPIIIYN